MAKIRGIITALFLLAVQAAAQTDAEQLEPLLRAPLQSPGVTAFQLRRYLMSKVPKMPAAGSAEEWDARAKALRQQILSEFVFRGWPREWVESPLKVEELGWIPSGKGYRMRKVRYEIVPGFYSTAILYEPEKLEGKVPAILDANGHGATGKAFEYQQKRAINQALQGMLALNMEWLGMGELAQPENSHFFYAHLDLAGASGLGLFYLAARKALDYLYDHPHVDRSRIGMTGLSGGGFQTILLSSLDERILAAVPVAGFASDVSRIERASDTGDIEHHASDMLATLDYPGLAALRAPRPTLLMYNAEDDCCYRGPLVKPYIFDQVKPIFRLYGREDWFGWHLNTDPSTHNYQLDNRVQSYRFFAKWFHLPAVDAEIPVDSEVKSLEELRVGLPEGSLSILGVAKVVAARIGRQPVPVAGPTRATWASEQRAKLARVLRVKPVQVQHAWALTNTHSKGLESVSYRFDFDNGLSATGVWLKALAAPDDAPPTIVLDARGKKAAAAEVSERVNRGEQVLAVDLLFTGDAALAEPWNYTQLITGLGDRPLGLEAAQLIGLARWLRRNAGVRLECHGMRAQIPALAAAALEPELFREVVIHDGIKSLRHLLEKPVEYQTAPDLFCRDLYKEFDLDVLVDVANRGSGRLDH